MKKAIVISASSDIGLAMCQRWLDCDWTVAGTYRTSSPEISALESKGMSLVHCDLSDKESIETSIHSLKETCPNWDVLVLATGLQDPVGSFLDCDFDEWESSIQVNFTAQLRIAHALLPYRSSGANTPPCVLFFAGGGANNATVNYSAYTISKIALIKMCELLDAEIQDARFAIVGPGWVKTKIHQSTLEAGVEKVGANYDKTRSKLNSDECTPMSDVLNCCDWIINSPRDVVSGRNFSVVFDAWGDPELESMLRNNFNMYKLRRHGNDAYLKNQS
ncbi:MAG: SDR family oxidoreductase [Candidatus Hinthialibacter antarcticus]|nr:SDR family oxidoreductase [Candidatus Hinthialibacter antarcticus]